MGLADYKNLVASAASICTIGQFFSPVFICRDIVKQGNTENVASGPFIGGMGMSFIALKFGLLLNDPAMIIVNIFALVLNFIYITIFFYYSTDKNEVMANIGKTAVGVALILGYSWIESPERIEFTFGLIMTILMLVLIGAPLLDLKEMIANKTTGTLPFPMILSGTVVTFLWLLHGIIIENTFMQIQNIIGFILCAFQLSLFAVFSPPPKAKPAKKD